MQLHSLVAVVFGALLWLFLSLLTGVSATEQSTPHKAMGDFRDPVTDCLLEWTERRGGRFENLKPATVPGGGRGLVARQKIEQREGGVTLVRLPEEGAICVSEEGGSPFPEAMSDEVWKDLKKWSRLAVLLLRERRRGRASPFFPFVKALPSEQELRGAMAAWEFSEVFSLSDTLAIEFHRETFEALRKTFIALSQSLNMTELVRKGGGEEETAMGFEELESCRQADERERREREKMTGLEREPKIEAPLELSEWRWAVVAVLSRAFNVKAMTPQKDDTTSCLIPIMDLINHKRTSYGNTVVFSVHSNWRKTEGESGEKENFTQEQKKKKRKEEDGSEEKKESRESPEVREESRVDLVMQTTEEFEEGEEVVWAYGGKHSNRKLLWTYGFIEEDNPFDELDLGPSLHILITALVSVTGQADALLRVGASREASASVGFGSGVCPASSVITEEWEGRETEDRSRYRPALSTILGSYPADALPLPLREQNQGKWSLPGSVLSSMVVWFGYRWKGSEGAAEGSVGESNNFENEECRSCSFFLLRSNFESILTGSSNFTTGTGKGVSGFGFPSRQQQIWVGGFSDLRCHLLSLLLERAGSGLSRALAAGEPLMWPVAEAMAEAEVERWNGTSSNSNETVSKMEGSGGDFNATASSMSLSMRIMKPTLTCRLFCFFC